MHKVKFLPSYRVKNRFLKLAEYPNSARNLLKSPILLSFKDWKKSERLREVEREDTLTPSRTRKFVVKKNQKKKMQMADFNSAPQGQMTGGEDSNNMNTLDEPIMDTIKRDLNAIGAKLYYVMLPRARMDKAQGLRQWDLWGPLFLCLALSTLLASQAKADQSGQAFAYVFIVIWVGSALITLNSVLLKGTISFFQSVCVLGYCTAPLVIAALCAFMVGVKWLKLLFVVAGFIWSTGASVGFMSEVVAEDRRVLAVYPVWLFYICLSWMILLA